MFIFCCFKSGSTIDDVNSEPRCFLLRFLDYLAECTILGWILKPAFIGSNYQDSEKYRKIKFNDYNEKEVLLSDHMSIHSSDDTESDLRSVDEGAIAVLTMDEIRNMKNA
jgi:hypothetical protein